MTDFHFTHPIEVRYADLDPQGHVDNAHFLTYFEQARVHYFIQLGLFTNKQSFLDMGIILADAHVIYLSPVLFGVAVHVGVRVSRLGTKSLTMEYRMVDEATGRELATGSTVLVTFDYIKHVSIEIPEVWRQQISAFEGLAG